MPELVGQRDQLGLGPAALVARLAVAGAGEERGLDALAGAGAQQAGLADAGVHTNTRSIAPSGSASMSATVRMPSTSSPCRLVPYTPPW
jgi:hypothetical protein